MTDHQNTYPDLASVEDWLNAKGYTGEAGACHAAMSLIRKQEKRIAELETEILAGNDWLNARAAVLQELAEANARIAELEAARREDEVYRVAAADAVESMRARIAALEAALKPFSDISKQNVRVSNGDLVEIIVTLEQLKAAGAALEGK